MDLRRLLAHAAQRAKSHNDNTLVGLIEQVHINEWSCTVSYVDPDKGTVVTAADVPLPNTGGTSFRSTSVRPGDMVALTFAKGFESRPLILAVYTVHNLQANNHNLDMNNLLGGY